MRMAGRQYAVSLLSLAVICFGVHYAYGREKLRNPEHLHGMYQRVNEESFGGALPDATLKVADLSADDAAGETYYNDKFVIALDPAWNTSEADAVRTIRHEACHVWTFWQTDSDPHGPRWQECMHRFTPKF